MATELLGCQPVTDNSAYSKGRRKADRRKFTGNEDQMSKIGFLHAADVSFLRNPASASMMVYGVQGTSIRTLLQTNNAAVRDASIYCNSYKVPQHTR